MPLAGVDMPEEILDDETKTLSQLAKKLGELPKLSNESFRSILSLVKAGLTSAWVGRN